MLSQLPTNVRVGLGVVNPKAKEIESVESIMRIVEEAAQFIGMDRLTLNPDCGFATFADNPVAASDTSTKKLAAMVEAAQRLRSSKLSPNS